jgi:tRNA G18 (ribose-2'-O)-methylase SpoU
MSWCACPITEAMESLNVAAAAAVALYEVIRDA